MKRLYYTGGIGELILEGEEPIKIADLEEVSLLVDYGARPLRADWEDFPSSVITGPGHGRVSCVVIARAGDNPFLVRAQAGAGVSVRNARKTVPPGAPWKIVLEHEARPETLVVETPGGDAFGRQSVPAPGACAFRRTENALYFHHEDAGRDVLVSYVSGGDAVPRKAAAEMGLVLVFPALGGDPIRDPAFRVMEAPRAVVAACSEEFRRGEVTRARADFLLLADEDGVILRQSAGEVNP